MPLSELLLFCYLCLGVQRRGVQTAMTRKNVRCLKIKHMQWWFIAQPYHSWLHIPKLPRHLWHWFTPPPVPEDYRNSHAIESTKRPLPTELVYVGLFPGLSFSLQSMPHVDTHPSVDLRHMLLRGR